MSKLIDMTGQTFGELTVLKRAENDSHGKAMWFCKCSCGNDAIVRGADLRSGHTKSCGCQIGGKNLVNLLGKRFGKLTVIEDIKKSNLSGHRLWKCKCDCGNETIVPSTDLKSGNTKSCGCQMGGPINLLGQRFGKLIVIEDIKKSDSTRHRLWKCKCDCGNETIVPSGHLISGNTTSCGCRTTSKGEEKIQNLLDSHNIKYKKEYTVHEIGNKRFDFAILNDKEEVVKLIEYDGEQHFQEWTRSNDTLVDRQARDKIKDEWAAAHNIPLLRIPYWDYNKIDFDMLQS